MKISVHIGSTKTGSSALQMSLFKARSVLLDHGIYYPESGTQSNAHHILFAAAHPGAWGMHKDSLPAEENDRFQYFTDTLQAILDRAEEIGSKHLVLSSEYWWAFLGPKFQQLIRTSFENHEVRLIACLRRQDRWLEASYLQAVKSGEKMDFRKWINLRLNTQNLGGAHYLKMLNQWNEILLPEETVVVPYEFSDRTEYVRTVVNHICDKDVGHVVVPEEAVVVNQSPNKAGVDAILEINNDNHHTEDRGSRVVEVLKSQSRPENTKSALLLTKQEQAEIIAKFEKINDMVHRLYGDKARDSLFAEIQSSSTSSEAKKTA